MGQDNNQAAYTGPERRVGQPPRFYKPGVGRRCRMYPSADMAGQYAQGWLNPEQFKPDACGTPGQQGALDRLMERGS